MSIFGTLEGRHALVCGASAGIGRATALALAAMGAQLSVLARRAERLEALLPELREAGATSARAVVADLDDLQALPGTIDGILATGPVHVVVNNTGGPPAGPILQASPDDFLGALQRHLLASHTLVQRLLPGMTAAGYGRIVNVVSVSVREPVANLGVSNTTRGAIASWAKTLAMELPPGITINNVLPGFTDTERLSALADANARRQGVLPEDIYAAWIAAVPERRLARPEETAAAIAFLCSPMAGYIRGINLPVDGGRIKSL